MPVTPEGIICKEALYSVFMPEGLKPSVVAYEFVKAADGYHVKWGEEELCIPEADLGKVVAVRLEQTHGFALATWVLDLESARKSLEAMYEVMEKKFTALAALSAEVLKNCGNRGTEIEAALKSVGKPKIELVRP